jgi:NCAIR mutase (PurE)-related protein
VVGIDNGFGAACAALRILGAGERVAPEHIGDAAGR